ncbi:MAG: oligosaccharide flippase family protein, partial [Bacteroidetes bacterium]|nr:oligosaccharide flippase family protein [Bacteroidota bacterium]
MKRKLLLNSFAGAANTIVNIGMMAATVPVFIDRLGLESYGIFALISLVSIINVIGSFGFSTSLIKYLAEQGRCRESDSDIQVTLVFLIVLSVLLTASAILLEPFILTGVLGLSAVQYTDDVASCFRYLVAANIFNLVMQTSFAVFDSLQKVYVSSVIQFGFNVTSRGGMLLVLLSAPSLSGMGFVYLIMSIGTAVVSVVAVFSVWGNFVTRIPWSGVTAALRKHATYSATVYVTTLFGLLYEVMTKIVVNRFIGISEVAIFDIAVRIKNLFWSIGER